MGSTRARTQKGPAMALDASTSLDLASLDLLREALDRLAAGFDNLPDAD